MSAILSAGLLGFVLGLQHATDGDHLVAVATIVSRERRFTAGALVGAFWGLGHMLTLGLAGVILIAFGLRVPPRLEIGNYTWQKKDSPPTQGLVRASSVTFLGGQNGPPSLGGMFQLISDDVPLYDVRIPTTPVDPVGNSPVPR